MAHTNQILYCESVKAKYPQFFKGVKVLDIGSLDINGSNRYLFEDSDYLGIDVGEGRNVDLVCVGHEFNGPDNYFDTIISTEVFEHDMYYEKTILNVMRMLKPGGLFVFTCASTGRAEHGTRRSDGSWAAPLLMNKDAWADYYKNLTSEDIEVIDGFKEHFPDGVFGYNGESCDLYFLGIKSDVENFKKKYMVFNDDVFIIDCWLDTKEKEDTLINLINRVKVFNVPIILCGHYPVKPEIQKMVDYCIYDKNNDILLEKDFNQYDVASDRWTEMGDYRVVNKVNFHHDYAIWLTMKNSFNLANQLGKKYIHFLEFDNLPEETQYRQAFLEYIRSFDAVVQEYDEGSTKTDAPYCATYIFSIRTDIALRVIEQIKTKEEFFRNRPNGWQLEKVFLQTLKNVTNSIYVSKYMPNDDELNIFAAWNRNGILRNGARFQTYLAVDNQNKLYAHFISGFDNKPADKDYLIEIHYNGRGKFYMVNKNMYHLEGLGEFIQGETVRIYYQGVEVFSEVLKDNVNEFKRKNQLTWKNKNTNRRVNVNFVDGPFVEILEDVENLYNVKFINQDNNKIEFELNLKSNHWARTGKKYFVNWLIKIQGIDNDFYHEHVFDPAGKRFLVAFESKSLGDNLAWMDYVDKFRLEKKCEVICSTFNNDLFKSQYPNIEFVNPGALVSNLYGLFRIGLFYKTDDNGVRGVNYENHKTDPKKEPLGKVASDILGLTYNESRTKLPRIGKNKQKRVCIAIHSTAQCKYWNNPTGWQDVVDYLKSKGYEVRLLSREENGYMGNWNPKGVVQQKPSSTVELIKVLQESEFFIGISSGLSWLAWASGIPVVLISGFTDVSLEPFDNVKRIINKDVCNSCWSNYDFDAGDWNWCPVQKGTDKQFECSKLITSENVIKELELMM